MIIQTIITQNQTEQNIPPTVESEFEFQSLKPEKQYRKAGSSGSAEETPTKKRSFNFNGRI